MGIFFGKRNQWLKVIEWKDDSKNTIVYRYPIDGDQIMFGSKLTVRESQVAIFVNKGQIADVFMPGIYTLSASNLPILTKLLSLPYGFKSPFYSEVYYVNTKQFTNQKWGTSNPVTMRDKDFGTIRLRGFGTYSFKVNDAELFLREIFGTNASYQTEDINDYLKSMIVSCISDTLAESKISALDLSSNLEEFNNLAKEKLAEDFEKMGLTLVKLVVENISFPEEVEKAIDQRSSMGVLKDSMDTYIKYQTAKAIPEAAKNPGMGGVGATLGAGLAVGEMVRDNIKSATTEKEAKPATPKKVCPECGTEIRKTAKFCPECGHKFAPEKKVCPECGTEMAGTAKFCPECGHKM